MFCNRCGTDLHPGQRFCVGCGKDISGPIAIPQPLPNRVQQNIRLVGILWLVFSGIEILGGIFMLTIANTILLFVPQTGNAPPPIPIGVMRVFFSAIAFFILIKALVGLFAGWGLLQRQSWARVLTIILSFFAVLGFPLGTTLGVFSLWVLLPAHSEREYAQLAAAPSA
jgi:hypothetical protein